MNIIEKQCLLKYLGYYKGSVDGAWGNLSQQATEAFQRQHNLTVDGQFGPKTEKQILESVYNGEFAPELPRADDAPSGTFWDEIQYFRRSDPGISCTCPRCGGFPVEPSEKLMRMADKIRAHFGKPMVPSSTVRCQAHNDELPGSAKNSLHIQGKAMDFAVIGVPVSQVIAYTTQLKQTGELNYTYEMVGTGHVHIDVK